MLLALLDELLRAAFDAAARRRAHTRAVPAARRRAPGAKSAALLDEAANIAPLPDLATLASTAGGEGIQLITIYQDLSQIRHGYGTEWGSIVSNHVAKVVLPGIPTRYFAAAAAAAAAAGEEEVLVTTTSTGADGRKGSSEHLQKREVVTQRDLRELGRGEGLCL